MPLLQWEKVHSIEHDFIHRLLKMGLHVDFDDPEVGKALLKQCATMTSFVDAFVWDRDNKCRQEGPVTGAASG